MKISGYIKTLEEKFRLAHTNFLKYYSRRITGPYKYVFILSIVLITAISGYSLFELYLSNAKNKVATRRDELNLEITENTHEEKAIETVTPTTKLTKSKPTNIPTSTVTPTSTPQPQNNPSSDSNNGSQNQPTGTTQNISLKTGWNTFSLYVVPADLKMKTIINPLITENSIVLVKNGSGKVLWPEYNIDDIGNLDSSQGYQIYVKNDTSLSVFGQPINLPFTISLSGGWSTISYPKQSSSAIESIFQPLMDDGSLTILKDENDKTFEKVGGVWVNNIGNLNPGEGYQIYLTKASSITFN